MHCVNFVPQVAYWDVFEGKSALRQLEASQSGAINGMHISQDGKYFVTGMAHYSFALLLLPCYSYIDSNFIFVPAALPVMLPFRSKPN